MNRDNLLAPAAKPFRIICVCLGNICRSPAAQGVLDRLIRREHLEAQFEVDSAGTASYHIGCLPDSRMISSSARRGYELTSKAKSLTKEILGDRQLVLAMDRENYAEIIRRKEGKEVILKLWSEYLDDSWPRDVPDPYYGGEAGFEYVLDMLEAAAPKILAECIHSAAELKKDRMRTDCE